MNEWTVVTVIIAIAGLIGTVAVPLTKNTRAMTELNGQLKLLTHRQDEDEKDLENFKAKSHDNHKRIFETQEKHTAALADHENRLKILEKE